MSGRRLAAVVGSATLLAAVAMVMASNPRRPPVSFRFVWWAVPKPPARALATPPQQPPLPDVQSIHVPSVDSEGRVVVPVSDAVPRDLPAEGVPFGWNVQEFSGRAAVDLIRVDGRLGLRLRTERSAFALFRDVIVDPAQTPFLTWTWRAARLPATGDAREPGRNDQAIGVYVVFPRWPSPRTASDVLGYVWDTHAPIGTRVTSARAANIRFLVVESGPGARDDWRRVQRDVAADYAAMFGRSAPRIGKVAVAADTDDTRETSEAMVGDLVFSRTLQSGTENPRIMLR